MLQRPLHSAVSHALVVAIVLVAGAGCGGPSEGQSTAEGTTVSQPVEVVDLHFNVGGMTCQGCVNFVQQKMALIDGVESCEVSLEQGQAAVKARDEAVAQEILNAFAGGGYTLSRAEG